MKASSEDLRERIVGAVVAEDWSRAQAARVFGVSVVSVGRLVRAWQAGASLAPRRGGGRPRKLRLAEHQAALRESVASKPDLELAARAELLAQSEGIHLSVPTLWRAMHTLGITRKKRLSAPASRTR